MTDSHTQRLEAALDGKYRIERKLGEGGMASVYLAEDIKHERKVALKILKPELAAVIGAERFLSEIKTTANLQHPHILPLFDSGEADGYLYYVMPFIDGETLREKLDRERQLGVDEAVRIARDVGDALDYAHRNEIIHRDIKPGNILLHDGRPVVADFGIALAVSAAGGGRMTETGLSLGTPHYMSPEQASADRDLSVRSDVYSLGCVLYEMIAGQPPHTGPSAQSVLVRILTESPRPLTELRHTVPPHISAVVQKSIEKLPADRFETAKQFIEALEDADFTYVPAAPKTATIAPALPPPAPVVETKRPIVPWVVAAVLTLVAAWGWLRPAGEAPIVQRYLMDLEEWALDNRHEILISPDGTRFAMMSRTDGGPALYWRNADEERFRLIPGTEGGIYPAFSPDGEWLVYHDGDADVLVKIALAGGAPRPVVPDAQLAPDFPSWTVEGWIAFSGQGGVYRVPDTGGEIELLLETPGWDANPRLLPGGNGLIVTNRAEQSTWYVDLETDSARVLVPDGIDARYAESGHLLYVDQNGGLWAQPFDPERGETLGEAAPVLTGISVAGGGFAKYTVSATGTLVHSAGGSVGGGGGAPDERLLIVDLEGNVEVDNLAPRRMRGIRWGPDGETIVYSSNGTQASTGPEHIYTYNVVLGNLPRALTFEGANAYPVWSPDGTRVAFRSEREGTDEPDLFVKAVGDDTPPTLVVSRPGEQEPTEWPEEDVLLFRDGSGGTVHLWRHDIEGDSSQVYHASEYRNVNATLSPDRTLAAYWSNESGTGEIYVRSFPNPRQPELVSRGGGHMPKWSPDGNTLYYWAGQGFGRGNQQTLVAARLRRDPSFAVLSTDTILSGAYFSFDWDLHPDGDRFLVTQFVTVDAPTAAPDTSAEPERFVVVVNWFEELKAAGGG